jgi:hypothetical protein
MVTKSGWSAVRQLSCWIGKTKRQRRTTRPVKASTASTASDTDESTDGDGDVYDNNVDPPRINPANEEDEYDSDSNSEREEIDVDEEVELTGGNIDRRFVQDSIQPESLLSMSNLLIAEKDLTIFITQNFFCKQCGTETRERKISVVKVGYACSLFWNCNNIACSAKSNIMAKQSTKNPEVQAVLGDYDINR